MQVLLLLCLYFPALAIAFVPGPSAGLRPRLGHHGSARAVCSGIQLSHLHLKPSIGRASALAMKPGRFEIDSLSSDISSQTMGIAESNTELVADPVLGNKKHRKGVLSPFADRPLSIQSSVAKTIAHISLRSAAVFLATVLSIAGNAYAGSLEDANNKLANYGFPPILFLPSGFKPIVSEYGRGNIRESMQNPILVQFAHPNNWVVQKTSVNNNGEAGTIAANDYIKGDTAYLYVYKTSDEEQQLVKSLGSDSPNKDLIRTYILKALSQKGDPVDNLKIYSIKKIGSGVDGSPYIQVDFGYQLNTEAGFLIGRRAVLSLTSVGDEADGSGNKYLQGLITATTDKRWRQSGLEGTLTDISQSFRVYRLKSGIFSAAN